MENVSPWNLEFWVSKPVESIFVSKRSIIFQWNCSRISALKKTNLDKMCKSRTTLGQVHETKFFKMNVSCQYVWTNWVNSNDYRMLHIVYIPWRDAQTLLCLWCILNEFLHMNWMTLLWRQNFLKFSVSETSACPHIFFKLTFTVKVSPITIEPIQDMKL